MAGVAARFRKEPNRQRNRRYGQALTANVRSHRVTGITDVHGDLHSRFPASEETSQRPPNRVVRGRQINDLRPKFPARQSGKWARRTGNFGFADAGEIPGSIS